MAGTINHLENGIVQAMNSALKNRIVATFKPFGPEQIILFGSQARAESDEWSDVDLLVIYKTRKTFLDRLKELYLAWDIPKAVDILAYTPEEFHRMAEESPFIKDAVEKGEVLYEKR
jgi:predicted nucleotidyltransferase